ncbi:MAG: manganese efflux pump MntP family protein [Candidatus Altiarchaeia archaeon]
MSIIPPEEYVTVVLIAVGLAMDCFAVSLCKGLATKEGRVKTALLMGLSFGFFQAVMPLIGFAAGIYLLDYISGYDHWIAFCLLGAVGSKMLWESFRGEDKDSCGSVGLRELLILSVATSIDALAVGLSFAFLNMSILFAAMIIGVVSFLFSISGFFLGRKAGERFGGYAEITGGLILVGIGVKILSEHMGLI